MSGPSFLIAGRRAPDMFTFVGRVTTRPPWLVCLTWLVVGLVLTLLAPRWDRQTHDDDIHFLPESCPSVRGFQLLEEAFPQDVYASRLILVVQRKQERLRPGDLALVDDLV